jgi:hypothetical protein
MQVREIRSRYRGVRFIVRESEQPGFYRYSFRIGDDEVEGRVRTALVGMAAIRARRAIARKLKQAPPS